MSDKHKTTLPAVVEPGELQREQMHPLVQAAVSGGNLDNMERLMDLQERWEGQQAKREYTRAMVALKTALPPVVKKDAKNTHHGWKYTTLEAMVEHVTGPLCEHGFSLGGGVKRLEGGDVEVTTDITHRAGHSVSITLSAPPDRGAKSRKTGDPTRTEVQGIMATTTSLRRTGISVLLGLASADLPDVDDGGPSLVKAVKFLERFEELGKTREEVEAFLGGDGDPVPLQKWDAGHLAQLQKWGQELAQ